MTTAAGTSPRQALFTRFSTEAMKIVNSLNTKQQERAAPAIMLTGGLRSPGLLHTVLQTQSAHLLGIGRMSITCPQLPTISLDPDDFEPLKGEPDLRLSSWIPTIPLLGAGVQMSWYGVNMRRWARGLEPDFGLGGFEAIVKLWVDVDVLRSGWGLVGCGVVVVVALLLATVWAVRMRA